jgi:hypothetical protein
MPFRQAVPALLLLSACTRAPDPCPADQRPREVVGLTVSIIMPGGFPSTYHQEYATMAACDAARRQVRSEMDALTERAKAVLFNSRAGETGWTDYRGRYRPPVLGAAREQPLPDLIASCSAEAIATQPPGAPNQPIPVPGAPAPESWAGGH